MLNHELSAQFRDCLGGAKVFIIDDDENVGRRFGIAKITFLAGAEPADTIIEAGPDSMTVETLVLGLAEFDPDGTAQIFIREDEDSAAYYDVKEVRLGAYHHSIIVGAFRADCA